MFSDPGHLLTSLTQMRLFCTPTVRFKRKFRDACEGMTSCSKRITCGTIYMILYVYYMYIHICMCVYVYWIFVPVMLVVIIVINPAHRKPLHLATWILPTVQIRWNTKKQIDVNSILTQRHDTYIHVSFTRHPHGPFAVWVALHSQSPADYAAEIWRLEFIEILHWILSKQSDGNGNFTFLKFCSSRSIFSLPTFFGNILHIR